MEQMDFVHLHVHSEYSLLDGAARITDLIQRAQQLGMKALALTDHGVMYGVIPFYKACRAAGIKPIIGMEVYVTDTPLGEKVKRGEQHLYHLTLLAETDEGYRNLIQLATKAHLEGFYYKPRVTKAWLKAHHQGLICLSGCLASELQQALLADEWSKARSIAFEYRQIFGMENYFIEIQDHGLAAEKRVNPRLIRLAEELDIPLVLTNDVHYTMPGDAHAHDCLLCIGTGKRLADPDRLRFDSDQYYLKSSQEMAQLFPHLPEAYLNTARIAERCRVDLPLGREILPAFPVPEGETAIQYLRKQCEIGLTERYEKITPEIRQRLEYELNVIGQMGYADYFLIVWDFVRYARQQGIMVGPGRGSAAGSLVAYVLKITDVDPIRYQLLFERFLNPERVSMPDIDIDFSDRRRDEVLHYLVGKYGRDRVAQIITFGTLGARACVRDVGRVLGLSLALVDQVAKLIPSGPGATLEKAVASPAELRKLMEEDERVAHLIKLARQLEGLARHTSIHAAGVVISDDPLTQHVPLQEGQGDILLTQYPMEDLEALGLLKMDLLGLRNLTLLEEIERIINHGRPDEARFCVEEIPFDDAATYALLSSGDTAGVFQLESEGMRSVLRRLKPSTFEDLIAVLALYRPGPMENIPLFIQAKHGETEIKYPHPDLEPILKGTYGIIVYQEQIMQIASQMAGFSLGEADLLRRAVSKKKREILEEERSHFVEGCLAQGYDRDVAEHVYDLIVRFADYGFNRSHSAAYAMIAYRLAYLKAHYPVAFLASLISMHLHSPEKVAQYLHQAARHQIKVLPPSVHHSEAGVTVSGRTIRLGLSVIKHVGQRAVEEIIRARAAGPFKNVLDFCQRVDLRVCHRRVIESLVLAGALDELGMHRAQILANLDEMMEMAERAQGLKESDQLYFFADELPEDYQWQEAQPFTPLERLKYEKEALGFYLSGHPLDPFRHAGRHYGAISLSDLGPGEEDSRLRIMGYVQRVKRITTKKGEAMAFLQLEDRGVELSAVVFPAVFQHSPTLFAEERLLLVEGKLERRADERQLVISRAADLTQLRQRVDDGPGGRMEAPPSRRSAKPHPEEGYHLFVKISPEDERGGRLHQLKAIFLAHRGETPVYLYYESRSQTVRLSDSYRVQLSQALLQRIKEALQDPDAVRVSKGLSQS